MKFFKVALGIFLLCFLPYASASIGVSPPTYTIDFSPGLEQEFRFHFLADPGAELNISVEGDMAQYVRLSKTRIVGSEVIFVNLKLPKELPSPGMHTIFISAEEQSNGEQGIVLLGIIKSRIFVKSPYPGKYAEVSLSATNANVGENVNLTYEVQNLGTESLNILPKLIVYDFNNESVQVLSLEPIFLPNTKSKKVLTYLDTSKYPAGFYSVDIFLEYGGESSARSSAFFRLGELNVHILNYTTNFVKDKINRFDVYIESFWGNPLENVYAEVEIPDYNIKFSTPSSTLNGFSKSMLTGYFDTTGIAEDKFKGKIILHYADKTTEKEVSLKFKKERNYLMYMLVGGIALLLIAIIFLIIWMRKISKEIRRK